MNSHPAGWYPQQDGTIRFWDGTKLTGQVVPFLPPHHPTSTEFAAPDVGNTASAHQNVAIEKIAHDLAMAYVINRHGPEVTGSFEVQSYSSNDQLTDVSGSGYVETDRLPGVTKRRQKKVQLADRHLFGLGPHKTAMVDTEEFVVDTVFQDMITDYRAAYRRILELLSH